MATAAAFAGEPVEVPNMVIRLVEQVDAPARETGALAVLNVTEGQLVAAGTLLARIEDNEASLALERAKIELEVARRNAENDVGIRFARKSLEVARAELQRCVDSVRKSPRSVSDSEMDRLRLLVEKGSLEVEQAQRDCCLGRIEPPRSRRTNARWPWRSSTGTAFPRRLPASWCGSIGAAANGSSRATPWSGSCGSIVFGRKVS